MTFDAPREHVRWLLTAIVMASVRLPVDAETPRAELGKRLQRFELAWERADGPRRAAAVGPMSTAVRNFFSMALPAAARELDAAWYVVRDGADPDAVEREAIALAVTATPLLADTTADTLTLSFEPCYDVPPAGTEGGSLRLAIEARSGTVLAERLGSWADARGRLVWTCGELPEGDHTLVVERVDGERRHAVARIGLSRSHQLGERLARVTAAAETPDGSSPTARATLGGLAGLLAALADSEGQETDYPAARLLRFAESLAAGRAAGGVQVEQREYAAVEHMVVVQAALDDVFAFLDRVAATRGAQP